MPETIPPLLVTACDAGSANVLAAVLPTLQQPWRLFAQAQAVPILAAAGVEFTEIPRCDWGELPDLADSLRQQGPFVATLAGTSWGPSIDKAAILAARAMGIPSAAIIEHWALYRERFARVANGRMVEVDLYLPDQVWVNDAIARAEAIAAGHDPARLRVVGQAHLERQAVSLVRPDLSRDPHRVVFVSERMAADFTPGSPLDPGFDEFIVLDGLIAALPTTARLCIKLHPQEAADKYDSFLAAKGIEAEILGRCDIGTLINSAGRLVGMVSMLLLEAALVRDDVISFMPGGKPEDFIGNRIGATLAARSTDELNHLLRQPPACNAGSAFATRFQGSAERLRAAVKELSPCG